MGQILQDTHTIFKEEFLRNNNRLDHVSQVMGYHPSYLQHFLKTQNFILRGDGPLTYPYRHYIAIMAAGRHRCRYLIDLQKQEFRNVGGDEDWLDGIDHVPAKLKNLYDINKILAHRPWLLSKSHIEKLTKGKEDAWSLAEVVQAIVILTHFHSLCSFVFSCGLNQEIDQPPGNGHADAAGRETGTFRGVGDGSSAGSMAFDEPTPEPPASPLPEPEVAISTLMQRMKTLSERSDKCSPNELAERFERIESQSAEISVSPPRSAPDPDVFAADPDFGYEDFAKRSARSTFRAQDYSWGDHGYSLVNRLYDDVGNLLDDKFKTAYDLTYYTMGPRRDVDTSRFRRAIWNYIQSLFGIRHDDYDYGEVNVLLERSLKAFVKSACCYPERVTKRDYDRVLSEFMHSEKVHVNLMVQEARMQAELIYALRTVNRYMTN